jgi:branched-chain amino acid aminotransferase
MGNPIPISDRDGFIWMDGVWTPWREANTHILTHSLHYGMGVFEGVRAYETPKGPAIFRLNDHTKRLFESAHILHLSMPYDIETLNKIQCEVLIKNNLSNGYIRPLCYLGSEGMGLRAEHLKTHIAISAWHWGAYLGQENLTNGIKVRTSSYSRPHINSTMSKAKATGNYLNSMLALREAVSGGAEEALLLDTQGYIAEGSGENIFLVKNGVLYTPELTSCLAGITRDTIITLAREHSIEVVERSMTRDEVYIADEAFFTGTAAEVTPIRELDDRKIGFGAPGKITLLLQKLYFDQVQGKRKEHPEWLTYVKKRTRRNLKSGLTSMLSEA